MFDRFIRLAKARKALREQRFADALLLASDPLIASDRRSEELKSEAAKRLVSRARQRLEAGDLGAARAELQRLRGTIDSPEVDSLTAEINAAASGEAAALELARRHIADVRRLLDRGETAAARSMLASLGNDHLQVERRQIELQLAERGRMAAAMCDRVRASLDTGAVEDAIDQLHRAEVCDLDAPEIATIRTEVVAAAGPHFAAMVREALRTGDMAAALDRFRLATASLPRIAVSEPMVAARRSLDSELSARFAGAASLAEASALAAACRRASFDCAEPVAGLVQALSLAHSRPTGEVTATVAGLEVAARAAGAAKLAHAVAGLVSAAATRDERLAEARRLLDAGQLDVARNCLTRLLAEDPMHEGARRELDLVDQGLSDLDRRLAEVRSAARAGRLREACTAAVALAGSARVAAEAQQVVTDARARMALVERGLDEVRVALHGRVAASPEGVRHCLLRLEELAKVQVDHEDLPKVISAVRAECDALPVFEAAAAALDENRVDEALAAIGSLLPVREKILAPDRLDARWCTLADRLGQVAERALAGGRLTIVERCAETMAGLTVVRAEFGARSTRLRQACVSRREAAEALVAKALESLDGRDLAEAERLAEEAQQQWAESADVRALSDRLLQLRRQSQALDRIEVLTKERDYLGAQQKLAEMPPTQQLLRTRIYDMKQTLARAQGLEGAFLLRVDEGGEQLVVRGETVTIGNVRQTRADLPVLANVAGRHASIRRSMSFHGGMQDTVVAEEGEVRVRGTKVESHALEVGDRVDLGPAFSFVYQRPCNRSLSVGLVLQGGFQIAGTDRIVLMKDRGRDGRIVLGPAKNVHVRVPKATGEVEVFAANTGQMRVFCDSGGTIDGVPFRGEHPVAAGQLVQAGGMTFLLLPWRPTV
ncbi:MAG TPA: hypothetical protein VFZ65_18580 [Planctomycetota bacterium]|nr:hypothetical protein [Planctomycetota bacterium]